MAMAMKTAAPRATGAQRLGAMRRVAVRRVAPARRAQQVVAMAAYPRDWVKTDPLVFGLGFLGWTIPSAIPTSAFGGNSLFGSLLGSIGDNLAHFPVGPALTDKFWLYLFCYHIGLFLTLTLGQCGVQGRKQGYW